jgi:hypothetical protein
MAYAFLAGVVLLLHLGFILFVLFGALAVVRWRGLLPWHLAAAVWGVGIELSGAICPLTWAENHLRRLAGGAGYRDGFVEHYLVALIYPAGLGRSTQYLLAAAVLAVNAILYAWMLSRRVKPDS